MLLKLGERVNKDTPKQAEIAKALGLSKASISKCKALGMPVTSVEAAAAWRASNINPAKRKGVQVSSTKAAALDGEDFLEARTRREVAEANLAEMKEADQRARVIGVEAVEAAWARNLERTQAALLQIPARVAPAVAGEPSVEAVSILLDLEFRAALLGLSGKGASHHAS